MAQELEKETESSTILYLQRKLELVKASERIQKQLEDIDAATEADNEDIFERGFITNSALGKSSLLGKEIRNIGIETCTATHEPEPFGIVGAVEDIPKDNGHKVFGMETCTVTRNHIDHEPFAVALEDVGSHDIPFESLSITWESETTTLFDSPGPIARHSPRPMFRSSSDSRIFNHVIMAAERKTKKPVTINKYDLETVLDLNHELKKILEKQGKQFVEFKDKTDHWETTILEAFNTKKQTSHELQALNNSEKCVMGSTFGYTAEWYHHSNCGDCNWLGVDGLSMFTTFQQQALGERSATIKVTSRDGFEHYKALWEYHMNSEHYNNGSVSNDVLK